MVVIGIKYLLNSSYLYRWRPQWTRPFVFEEELTDEVLLATRRPPIRKALALFVLAMLGLGAEIVQLLKSFSIACIALTVAWVSLLFRYMYQQLVPIGV